MNAPPTNPIELKVEPELREAMQRKLSERMARDWGTVFDRLEGKR